MLSQMMSVGEQTGKLDLCWTVWPTSTRVN